MNPERLENFNVQRPLTSCGVQAPRESRFTPPKTETKPAIDKERILFRRGGPHKYVEPRDGKYV